jgi:hypothetical protein
LANRTGIAKFEPAKSVRIATLMAMTLPAELNRGPPDPPAAVCAS